MSKFFCMFIMQNIQSLLGWAVSPCSVIQSFLAKT